MLRREERPDEAMIHAWLDGELDAAEAARVERLVAEDAEWAAAAAEARGLVAASSRILGALDVVAGDVIPRGGRVAGTDARATASALSGSRVPALRVARRVVPTWLRVAAGFVFVAGVAYVGQDWTEMESAQTQVREAGRTVPPDVASTVKGELASDATVAERSSAGRSDRESVESKQSESDLSSRDAMVAASPIAPTSVPALTTAPPPVRAVAPTALPLPVPQPLTPVPAPNVASGIVSPPAAEPQAMLGAAPVAAEREARAKTMQRVSAATRSAEPERFLDSPNAIAETRADRLADDSLRRAIITGCWRTQTAARVDSLQSSLRIVRAVGDTLVLALTPAGTEARVVRESDTVWRGTARDASGASAPLRVERTTCAP